MLAAGKFVVIAGDIYEGAPRLERLLTVLGDLPVGQPRGMRAGVPDAV